MTVTFILHCSLTDVKSNSFIENILITAIRDICLCVCCFWNNGIFNKNCEYIFIDDTNYTTFSSFILLTIEIICINIFDIENSTYSIRSIIYTIIYSLLVARFFNAFNLCCSLDILTVYFLIWQIMCLIVEWESEKLPLISLALYRGWLCMMPACIIFFVYDLIFRSLSIQILFLLLWLTAFADVFRCLHRKNAIHNTRILNEFSTDGKPSLIGLYYSWNFDDNESDETDYRACLGLGDFAIFDFMLLLMLHPLSSTRTKLYVTIGHIIAVQIGHHITDKVGWIYKQPVQSGVPMPVIVVSLYAILILS